MATENILQAEAARTTDFVDDLFDYDVGLDGILQEISTNTGTANAPKETAPPDNSGVVLGLDEEVKVAKKRQPIPKLDENRLLTQAGVPKLRRSAKKNLKFKGKGHEFSDLARLLNFYQLWLDDLFPRAKFADGLAMIERLGHSKRVQTMRRAWIDEEKTKTTGDDDDILENDTLASKTTEPTDQAVVERADTRSRQTDGMDEDLFMPDEGNAQRPVDSSGAALEDDDLDELDALLRDHESEPRPTDASRPPLEDDDLDELDALLREREDGTSIEDTGLNQMMHDATEAESHADELEAMDELDMLGEIPR
ncbi:replication fork protection component Swi3-domain-containing protein [Aspergillus pseudoustus]|uniref:Chromosome segregation in meiosis protein n=1 Tax=Aspergillus pseudoustus TaxID=1810923 RepID=A0ABR4J7P0_9EURO